MGFSSFNQQNNHGIMGDEEDDNDSIVSSSSCSSIISTDSIDSDLLEDANSSSSSSSSQLSTKGPLFEMSSIMQQLPFKRGLSKHFNGKSQSFTSLSDVTSLEDLAKPENPCKKKMKSCKSYGGLLAESHKISPPKACSRTISKHHKASRGSCSSLSAKRNNSILGNKPPIPPQRSSNTLCNQTPLFA